MDMNKERILEIGLVLRIIGMILASVLIYASAKIFNAKPCELETALAYISTDEQRLCKYNTIKGNSSQQLGFGISSLVINIVFFGLLLVMRMDKCPNSSKTILRSLYFFIIISAISFFSADLYFFITVAQEKGTETTLDDSHLRKSMMALLEKQYTSDDFSDKGSKGWNMLFVKYDCCAVNEVTGSANDFDNTPWCTTSGSCQDTASVIPKTCCKGVTQDSYKNAPSSCYYDLVPGTYGSGCIAKMTTLSRENISD
uniref:Uncharacterized protein LOC111122719 isoform X2 n=1 Tax=Crassostrea virginica TaxID=6565 RepID=A0A8B8CWR8_CRAVI|nr:uncharacterized protein LOC111122719 isoform X2 [Crassostrea virginica]